jgi:hypothetical protein
MQEQGHQSGRSVFCSFNGENNDIIAVTRLFQVPMR